MRYLFLILCFLFSITAHSLTLLDNAPARYEVQPGDTLWEIANRYLAHPWEWKALWRANPHIKNPKRLYPGAVLELHYYKKNPYLKVLSNGTIKLSPYMRPLPTEDAIPAISLNDIKPFLDASVVLDWNSLADAPYVVAFTTEHMLGGQSDEIYVKNLCPPVPPPGMTISYAIYRPAGQYVDPATHGFLGYKATLVGYAQLLRRGEPATILLTDILQGVKLKDRVMPRNFPEFNLYFEPKTPKMAIQGQVIDIPGQYSEGGVGLVAVVNRGKDAGLQSGDVLAIYSKPRFVPDPKCPTCEMLPPERVGEAMVFRTFTHTSFMLVVRSIRSIHPRDLVMNP